MYLKNTSDTKMVMINTIVGKVGIRPGETIDLKHKLLPPLSPWVIKTTEEEYRSFCKGLQQPNQQTEEVETEVVEQIADENQPDEQIEEIQNIVEEVANTVVDNNVMDFVKNLLNPQFEEKGQEPKTDPLIVKETDSKDQVKELEDQIEELKKTWTEAKAPRKKDKISKQIKELQKQLEKLNKDIERNKINADDEQDEEENAE